MTSPTLDGSATGLHSSTNTNSATLTTTKANDIIVVMCACELGTGAPAITGVSGGGLTWTKRKAVTAGASNSTSIELWWALAPTALSAVAITATYASNFDDAAMVAFGVNGCNTAQPWDLNASVPAAYASSSTSAPTWTISTNNPDNFLVIGWGAQWGGTSTAVPTGFTNLANVTNSGGASFCAIGSAYESVSSKQSSQTITWGGTIAGNPAAILDALTADISLRAATTPTNQSTTTATVGLPTGTTTGDVTVISSVSAQASNSVAGATATVPTGWTAVVNIPGFLMCYRAYQAGDPTTISITWSASAWVTTGAVTYAGCDTANPIDSAAWCLTADQGSATPPLRAPSLAPRYPGGQVVCAYGYGSNSSGITLTLPSGLTSESSSTAGPSLTIADVANGTASTPTGNKDASTLVTSGFLAFGCQVLLKASGAAALTRNANFLETVGLFQSNGFTASSVSTFPLSALGVQVGDLVLLAIASAAATITPPTGWTTAQTSADGVLCYRVAQSGDTSTPTISFSASAAACYEIVVLRPSYALTSGSVAVDTSGQTTGASSTTVATPSVVPATTSDFLAIFAASKGGAATWSLSAGPTRDLASNTAASTQFAWEQPSANPSGSFTWTASATMPTLTAWSLLAKLSVAVPAVQPSQMIII